jgi:RNA polymerase sigma factor (sigma-70 family)
MVVIASGGDLRRWSDSQKLADDRQGYPDEVFMEITSSEDTSPTLLGRVGQDPSDHAAWTAFVARYGPKINGWCRQRGLQPADAEDVTQDVLLRLARALKTFTYDPSRTFRGWLRMVTQHALSDFFAERKRRPGAGTGDDQVLAVLETVQARDDLLAYLDQDFAREVVGRACAIVRTRVEPKTWEAFRLAGCEGRPGEEVAAKLGMNVTAVFKAKSRILGFIREEVARLEAQS